MKQKNKYVNRSKISEAKFRQLVKLFYLDLDANQMAELSNLNRNTVNRYLRGIRQRIAEYCEQASPMSGQIEVDESFFGARRPGKRGRGAAGKTIVFGLFKRNGKVYTEIVPDCAAMMALLMSALKNTKSHFYLHLKECEFRFNHRSDDIYQPLLKIIKNNPLF